MGAEQAQKVEISIVIPVYNSTATLIELHKRIRRVMEELRKSFEIIYVDDCSPNLEVGGILADLVKSYPEVSAYRLVKNFGQFGATLCGISHARGTYIVTMDDDLQHLPEDVPALYEYLKNHPDIDVAVGIPKKRQHPLYRNIGSSLLNFCDVLLLKKPRNYRSGSFRIMRKAFSRVLTTSTGQNMVLGPLIIKNTKRLANVECSHGKRCDGSSGYTLSKLVRVTLNKIFNYTSWPLRLVGVLGFSAFILSILFSMYMSVKRLLLDSPVPGYASIVVLISLFGGAILFCFGVVGEYLIRILENTQAAPSFIEEEITAEGIDT